MGASIRYMVLPAVVVLPLVLLWASRTGRHDLYTRCLAGLWAGAWATLAYDVVRVPIAWSGIPVFKAISYFGTVITGQTTPTMVSEIVGWTYHLSNGMGFGLMYTALVPCPHWWSAVLWGLLLEGMMLVTPYAEVFGYKVSPGFLTITIGAHVVYGVVLWAALRYGFEGATQVWAPQRPLRHLLLAASLVPIGIGVIAADFHRRYSATLPPSPRSTWEHICTRHGMSWSQIVWWPCGWYSVSLIHRRVSTLLHPSRPSPTAAPLISRRR
jgi:hypothetical protein